MRKEGRVFVAAFVIVLGAVIGSMLLWRNGGSGALDRGVAHAGPSSDESAEEGSEAVHISQGRVPVEDPGRNTSNDSERAASSAPGAGEGLLGDDPLRGELERVGLMALSDEPDLAAMKRIAALLAEKATVVEGSVAVDESDGTVRGALAFEDSDLRGTFTIDGSDYSIEIAEAADADGFLQHSTSFRLREDRGSVARAQTGVQWHPDTRSRSTGEEPEKIVGWGLVVSEEGTIAAPTRMAPGDDGRWRIGNLGGEVVEQEWEHSRSDYSKWLEILGEHKQ